MKPLRSTRRLWGMPRQQRQYQLRVGADSLQLVSYPYPYPAGPEVKPALPPAMCGILKTLLCLLLHGSGPGPDITVWLLPWPSPSIRAPLVALPLPRRSTAAPCERFEEGPGLPPCKENDMRFCQTDLAANAYRLSRMLEEDRRFGTVDPTGGNGANDGILAQILKTDGWKVSRDGRRAGWKSKG